MFLARGIGITPIRSILEWASQERLLHKLYLFYSNREADDAAFIEEFESMAAQNPNFTLIPTITGHKTLAWPYEKGHINREMLTRYLLGLNGPIYYVAGPSGIVTAMTGLLNASGVSDDDIFLGWRAWPFNAGRFLLGLMPSQHATPPSISSKTAGRFSGSAEITRR